MRKTTIKSTNSILDKGIVIGKNQLLIMLDINKINVDHAYQRGLNNAHTERIAQEYKQFAVGVIRVALRKSDKKYYVIDGQHRLAALKILLQMGKITNTKTLCILMKDTTFLEEAEVFVLTNTNKPVTGNSRFRADIVRQHEPAYTIKKWAEDEGFAIQMLHPGNPAPSNSCMNGIKRPVSLLTAYHIYGDCLKNAFKLLKMAWGKGDPYMVPSSIRTGEVIYCLTIFLSEQGEKDDLTNIINCVKKYGLGDAWKDLSKKGSLRRKELKDILVSYCRG